MSLRRHKVAFPGLILSSLSLFVAPATALVDGFSEHFKAGETAFAKNNYGLAERNFLSALKEGEKLSPKDHRLSALYKNLAQLYEVRGNNAKAELYYEKNLRSKEKELGSEHPQVITTVASLVRFYVNQNRMDKAQRLTNLLLAYSEKTLKEQGSLNGHLAELTKFYERHVEYKEALEKVKQLKEANDKIRADDHLELAAGLDALASSYREKGKANLAESLFKKALDLRERTLRPGHLALAFSYDNLATFYESQGKTALAQPLYKKALELTESNLDLKRPETYARLDKLAQSYLASGQLAEAETLYKKALQLMEQNAGSHNRDIGASAFALAGLYIRQGRYSEAEPLLKRSLAVSEGIHGPQSASLLPVIDAYINVLEKCNKLSDAGRLRARSASIKGTLVSTSANSGEF